MTAKSTQALARAKSLRRAPTIAERAMWRVLKTGPLSKLNWRKQTPFGRYILDFVSHPARLVVEGDGGQHNESGQALHDQQRTSLLEGNGYRALRFWNNEVLTNADGVFRILADAALASPARARVERWKEARQTSPSMGEVGARSAAGGGDRGEFRELPLEADPQNAERTPPPALRATSPIEGEVRAGTGSNR